MTFSSDLPEPVRELVAGYVLGDLSSAEAEQVARLLAESPELAAEVAALQEALALMPYGLEPVSARPDLRSQLLTAAGSAASPPRPSLRPQRRWLAIAAGLIAVVALGQLARRHIPPIPQIAAAPALEATLTGLDQLLADHRRSLANPAGPADFTVRQPAELLTRIEGFQTSAAALPLLPTGQLVGASNCRFGKIRGLRLTYRIDDQNISAYQLAAAPGIHSDAHLILEQPDGTTAIVWREEDYLYALVAELPTARLKTLATAMGAV